MQVARLPDHSQRWNLLVWLIQLSIYCTITKHQPPKHKRRWRVYVTYQKRQTWPTPWTLRLFNKFPERVSLHQIRLGGFDFPQVPRSTLFASPVPVKSKRPICMSAPPQALDNLSTSSANIFKKWQVLFCNAMSDVMFEFHRHSQRTNKASKQLPCLMVAWELARA